MSWSFRGTNFERRDPGADATQWFPITLARTVDIVAGDVGASPRRYVDIGAREHGTLSLVAACATAAERAELEGAFAQSGALASVTGRSCTAMLVKADALVADNTADYRIALEFEFIQ